MQKTLASSIPLLNIWLIFLFYSSGGFLFRFRSYMIFLLCHSADSNRSVWKSKRKINIEVKFTSH